ncbi:hypothetical protein N7471_000094 [Penicillium samsonianum]|uniref:uncharacterized protein n=1 Tax=Penicillium samsonianum TaxID=1882272 RepID=UPI0025475D0A|nr:uncharacterized protein N7471_000094 [Penicillium samsonianum]KAJ6148895.1 hypothetical protein N7471_000094 [Penicillium samsonianum]
MKLTWFTLAIAGFTAAQSLDNVNPCVHSYLQKAFPAVGCNGDSTQIATCACKPDTQARLLAPVTQCVIENKCNVSDLLKAQAIMAEGVKMFPLILSGV